MRSSKFKVYYYYQNLNLWKFKSVNKLKKRKWILIKQKSNIKYLCHYRKLNIVRLYYFKFINKQILKKYFVNLKEFQFKKIWLYHNYTLLEQRLDFNLYKANFLTSLYEVRFFITKGFVFVNKKCIQNCNYLLKTNDLVELHPFLYQYLEKIKLFKFNSKSYYNFRYLRNLEIDYKTFSFIFLNNPNFFIINYKNLVKKFKIKNLIKDNNNSIKVNNYYKFVNEIFNNYLFFNQINNNNTRKYISLYKTNVLLKFLKYKYNDYYFRNILLKYTIRAKYNYLYFLFTKNINNYFNFDNIFDIFQKLYDTNFSFQHNKFNNFLNMNFFNYYYNLIFNYYIFILRNYYKFNTNKMSNFIHFVNIFLRKKFSINYYDYIILLNYKFFKLLNIKNKLSNFYYIKYPKIYNLSSKKIDYKKISQITNSKYHYLSAKTYKCILFYISSNKFSYKLYKRCNSFQQNYFKRIKILKKFQKSFNYTKFNCSRYGIYKKKLTKHFIYNQLKSNNIKISKVENSNFDSFFAKKLIYYPKNSTIYKTIYSPLFRNFKINNTILMENIKKLDILYITLKTLNINFAANTINNIYRLEKQLYFKLQNYNKSLDFNFNKRFKDIYLFQNLLDYFFINKKIINFRLLKLNSKIQIKLHYLQNMNYTYVLNNTKKYSIKKYKRFINNLQRCKLEYYYYDLNKTRTLLPTNLKYYFSMKNVYKNNIKSFYTYYYSSLFDSKKNLSTKFIKKKNFNLLKKYNKKLFNFYKSKYFNKRLTLIVNKCNNSNIYNFYNLELINDNFKFNDYIFLIDLVLNLAVRKINFDYNKIDYKILNYNQFSLHNKNFVYYKKLIISNKKNNNFKMKCNKFFYKSFYLKNYINIYNTQYLNQKFKKYNNGNDKFYKNRINYNYNYNYKNIIINKQLFKLYYGYFNYLNLKCSKIFIQMNKQNYLNNIYKIYSFYILNIRKYNIIKYIYNNYIFKEYSCFINNLFTSLNMKKQNSIYLKKLFYNILFTNFIKSNTYYLKNNFIYSKNLQIIINYFTLIKRFYD